MPITDAQIEEYRQRIAQGRQVIHQPSLRCAATDRELDKLILAERSVTPLTAPPKKKPVPVPQPVEEPVVLVSDPRAEALKQAAEEWKALKEKAKALGMEITGNTKKAEVVAFLQAQAATP